MASEPTLSDDDLFEIWDEHYAEVFSPDRPSLDRALLRAVIAADRASRPAAEAQGEAVAWMNPVNGFIVRSRDHAIFAENYTVALVPASPSSAAAQAVPPGFWLAPMKATEEMLREISREVAAENQWEAARDSWLARHPQPAQAVPTTGGARNPLNELRETLCAVGIVGEIDGHAVIRRDSVIELIDRRCPR